MLPIDDKGRAASGGTVRGLAEVDDDDRDRSANEYDTTRSMGRHYLPRSDAAFANWTRNFANRVEAEPSRYGVSVADAMSYRQNERRFAEAYFRASRPELRTSPAVATKDQLRRELEFATRRLAPIIRSTLGPDAGGALSGLGLPPASTRRNQVRVADHAPSVRVEPEPSGTVAVALSRSDVQGGGRGRPQDAIGAMIFLHTGDHPQPTERWPIAAMTTGLKARVRPDVDLLRSMHSPRIWVTACWLGPRLDRSPLSPPTELAMVRPDAAPPPRAAA
jgi:hypothetical protein